MFKVKERIDSAPRFRKEYKGTTNKEFEDYIYSKTNLTYAFKEIKNVLNVFNDNVIDEVIGNRDGITLPGSLGRMFIGSCKVKTKVLDYKKSQELGKKVYHQNHDSNGYVAKIFYTLVSTNYKLRNSRMFKFKNAELYGLKTAFNFHRKVAKIYPNQWKMYRVIDPNTMLEKQEKMNFAIMKSAEIKEELLKTYNEFDL